MKPFETSSYRSQVYQLRQLANNALQQYDLKVTKLEFINHGENATYKVITRKGDYLLRIHRDEYHTQEGIREELAWLSHLQKRKMNVQMPVASKAKEVLIQAAFKGDHLRRNCTVMTWKEGVFRSRSIDEKNCKAIGRLLGEFHQPASQIPIKARRYWHPDGLLGKDDRFNGLFVIEEGLSKKEYAVFNECREALLAKLKDYDKRFPKKSGLIHADLHFGNVIWDGAEPVPIDFDDCGIGFHLYDLCINLKSVENHLIAKKKEKLAPVYFQAMLDGYSEFGTITKEDIALFPYLRMTRDLSMFAWLYSRRDNESIFKYFEKGRKKRIEKNAKFLKEGPNKFFIK